MVYKSSMNQPDRLFLSSSNDDTSVCTSTFSQFENRLRTPVLEAKKCMLLRAQIPNAMVNIPDYALVFAYYKTPDPDMPRSAADIHIVRLMPSWWQPINASAFNMPSNQFFASPNELVNALNQAATLDSTTYNPSFLAGDIVFSYDSTTKRISFTGTDGGSYYEPVAYNSPNLNVNVTNLKIPVDINNGYVIQQVISQYSLNLRLGYSQPNDSTENRINPWFVKIGGNAITFDSYPNLIYSQCYYIYSNITVNATLSSSGAHNVLAVIPCSAPQLSVTNYTALTPNWLTRVSNNINSVTIQVMDDNNQPVVFPDGVNVNVEVGFMFE